MTSAGPDTHGLGGVYFSRAPASDTLATFPSAPSRPPHSRVGPTPRPCRTGLRRGGAASLGPRLPSPTLRAGWKPAWGVSRGTARTRTWARTATTGRCPTRPPAASPAHGTSRTTCPPGRRRAAVCSPSLSPLAGVQPGRRPAGERLRSGASSAVTRAPTCRGGAWVQSIWVMGPFRKVPRDPGVGCVGPPPRPGP